MIRLQGCSNQQTSLAPNQTTGFSLPLTGLVVDREMDQLPLDCLPLSTPLHTRVGSFNRQAQAAYYANQVLRHIANHDVHDEKCQSNWMELDCDLQALFKGIIEEAANDWELCCEAAALTRR
jgi:hypothetical protein